MEVDELYSPGILSLPWSDRLMVYVQAEQVDKKLHWIPNGGCLIKFFPPLPNSLCFISTSNALQEERLHSEQGEPDGGGNQMYFFIFFLGSLGVCGAPAAQGIRLG